jgi:hypothetical protein
VENDRLVQAGDAWFEQPQVPPAPSGGEESLDNLWALGCQSELEAGVARLADLQHGRSPLPDVAEMDSSLVDAGEGQILPKGAGSIRNGRAQLLGPPGIVIAGIDVDRLIGPAMETQVGLMVSNDPIPSQFNRPGADGSLSDATQNRVAPSGPDLLELTDIDREERDHVVTDAARLTASTSSARSSSVWKTGTECEAGSCR